MIQTSKDYLYRLIDELPEAELSAARRFLEFLRTGPNPVTYALDNAPWDDEPLTEGEEEAIREAREDVAAGRRYSLEEVKRDLNL